MRNGLDQMPDYTQMLIYMEMAFKHRLRQAVWSTLNELQVYMRKKPYPFWNINNRCS